MCIWRLCVYVYMEVVCVCVYGCCVYVYMEVVCVCVYGGCVYVYVEVVGQNISCRLRLFRHTRVQPPNIPNSIIYHPKGRIFGSADLNVPKPIE